MSGLTRSAPVRQIGAVLVRILLWLGMAIVGLVLVEAWRPDWVLWLLGLAGA
ncbi:hypothetical protein [Microlunatus ginsengisoli]|uniref:Uncharacterized protein n=1 Tax=Microlunatus ginsengisoli TaxID=363863 RepID=A0ABP7AU94_9ACTN